MPQLHIELGVREDPTTARQRVMIDKVCESNRITVKQLSMKSDMQIVALMRAEIGKEKTISPRVLAQSVREYADIKVE